MKQGQESVNNRALVMTIDQHGIIVATKVRLNPLYTQNVIKVKAIKKMRRNGQLT